MFREMKKLIELLNEYEGQDTWSYDEEMGMPYYWWGDDCDYEAYLISKKYWFIKWLVENEKVEENSDLITLASELWCAFSSDVLLMYLAIQDEPIQFLVSIIK